MLIRRNTQPRRPATVAVETAFVLIPCCLLIFAVLEFGRVVMVLQVLNSAARAGARNAVSTATSYIDSATATKQVTDIVNGVLAGQNLKNVTVQIYQADPSGKSIGAWTSAPFGQNIVVQIDADFPLVFPTFNLLPNNGAANNSMHLTVKSMMRGEAN